MSWHDSIAGRTARRFAIVFILGGLSSLILFLQNLPPEQTALWIPVMTAALVAVDKYIREKWSE